MGLYLSKYFVSAFFFSLYILLQPNARVKSYRGALIDTPHMYSTTLKLVVLSLFPKQKRKKITPNSIPMTELQLE